ncbi:MAG: hypothetical protein DMG76_23750 [Acidobacteria bacterium]|nr:MAG: hypothetical protein DMG76_23750 [Acidobacteriota bacterium]
MNIIQTGAANPKDWTERATWMWVQRTLAPEIASQPGLKNDLAMLSSDPDNFPRILRVLEGIKFQVTPALEHE